MQAFRNVDLVFVLFSTTQPVTRTGGRVDWRTGPHQGPAESPAAGDGGAREEGRERSSPAPRSNWRQGEAGASGGEG